HLDQAATLVRVESAQQHQLGFQAVERRIDLSHRLGGQFEVDQVLGGHGRLLGVGGPAGWPACQRCRDRAASAIGGLRSCLSENPDDRREDSGDGGGGDWNKASCDQVGLVPGPLSEISPYGCKPTSGRPARAQNGAFAPRWATERTTTPGGIIRPHSGNRSDATPGVAAGLCTGSRACTGATAGWPPHAARRREADRKPPELARKPGSSDRKAPEPCTQPPEPCAQGKKPCVQPLAACAQSRKPCARPPPAPAASPGTLRASRRALRAKLPCLARKRQSLARHPKSPARGAFSLAMACSSCLQG